MSHDLLAVPWGRPGHLYSAPGSLVLKLRLGEAPAHVPALADVRAGHRHAASSLDGGPVDRLLRHFSDRVAIARVHMAARSRAFPGRREQGFDQIEHTTGLARTMRVDLSRHAPVADIVDAVRGVSTVEAAAPNYLSVAPFGIGGPPVGAVSDAAWASRELVGAPAAMAYEAGDPAVVVGIVDTGVDLRHPELRDRFHRGRDVVTLVPGEVAAGVHLLAEPGSGDEPEDNVGHGTACAGIIGGWGQMMPPGLAGGCGMLPIRVLAGAVFPGKTQAVGIGAISDIDRGVKAAIDLGAAIVNMSFGTPEDDLDPHDLRPHEDVVQYGLARGCVMVAAAGNSGRPGVFSPGSIDGVIAVGAAQDDGRPAPFSTSGPHVALLAPGVRVISSSLDGYAATSGTSFAAPFVAAAAALLVSRARSRAVALASDEVQRLLMDAARPHPPGTATGNGAGSLQVDAALRRLDGYIDSTSSREAS